MFSSKSSEFQKCHYYSFWGRDIPHGYKPHIYARNFQSDTDTESETYVAIYGTQSKDSSAPDGVNIEAFCQTPNGVGHCYGCTISNPTVDEVEYAICLFNKTVAEISFMDEFSYTEFKKIMRKNNIYFIRNE